MYFQRLRDDLSDIEAGGEGPIRVLKNHLQAAVVLALGAAVPKVSQNNVA